MIYMYLVYRIKQNGRYFLPDLLADGLYETRKEANKHLKNGWSIKRISIKAAL